MTYVAAEARQQLLDTVAEATDRIGFALAALGEAYEQLDGRAADTDLGNGVVARVASMQDLTELKRESGDLAAAAHLAALSHEGENQSEFDDPAEDREWPGWINRMWNRFEHVDDYLTRVVYGDGRIHS